MEQRQRLTAIRGVPPLLYHKPVGCPFAVRCNHAFERCKENPPLMQVGTEHGVACWWNVVEGRERNV
jgi:peptide/nickel transport system ATP-binding protein